MSRPIVVVTTSYPRARDDAEGHFVGAEVRRLCAEGSVTVVAPGRERVSLWGERVVGLAGGEAFGFPGALARLRERPLRTVDAARFVYSATRWLRQSPTPARVLAHFVLPCGVPIATRGLAGRACPLEVVLHGSDARLLARLPGRTLVARELLRSGARLRFVSEQLRALTLASFPKRERALLAALSLVQASPIDVDNVPARSSARAELGLAIDAKIAIVVARLVPSKRVEVALEACRRVHGLTAIVIGDGPERARLSQSFPHARFLGHIERQRALAYISAANVLVSASLDEGAPTVVREARSLGTPVVCLAAGDLALWAQTDPGLTVVA